MQLRKLVGIICLPFLINCTQIPPVSRAAVKEKKYPLNVSSITPYSDSYEEGLTINIYGWGFDEGARAFVGEKECRETEVVDSNLIVCTVCKPDHYGDHSVTVMNPDGVTKPTEISREDIVAICDKYDRECLNSDGLIYFHFIKPMSTSSDRRFVKGTG